MTDPSTGPNNPAKPPDPVRDKPATPPAAQPAPEKPRRHSRLRLVLAALAVLMFVPFGLAFYLTTDSGVRNILLPLVSKKIGVSITAGHAVWSPLSSLTLDELRVGLPNDPILQVKQFTAQYDGRAILRGNYEIKSLILDSPIVHLAEKPDGSFERIPSILQPKRFFSPASGTAPLRSATGSSLPSLAISEFTIKNLDLTYVETARQINLQKLQLNAKNFKPGGAISLDLETDFGTTVAQSSSTPKASALRPITGHVKSTIQLQVNDQWIPRAGKVDATIEGLKGSLGGETLDGLSGQFSFDLAMVEKGSSILKQGQITISRSGAMLTSLSATGPLDPAKDEAELDVQIGPLKSNVLNVLFAGQQLDFLDSSVSYVGHFSSSRGGNLLSTVGKLEANPLNIASPRIPTGALKPVTLTAEHALELDVLARQIRINQLDLDATQQGKPMLKSVLSKPLLLSLKGISDGGARAGNAVFTFQVFPMDFTPYLPLMGLPTDWKVTSALLDANAKIMTADEGRILILDGHIGLSRFALAAPHATLADATVLFDGKLDLQNLLSARFQHASFKVLERGKPLWNATLDGKFNLLFQTGAGLIKFDASLPSLLAVNPIADLAISSGSLSGTLDWQLQKKNHFLCKGNIAMADLNLVYQKFKYQQMALAFSGNADWRAPDLKLDDVRLTANIAGKPAGSWQGDLSWRRDTSALVSSFKTQDLKETMFAPLFAVWLPDKKLRSIELTGQGRLKFENGVFDVKTTADIKKLLVEGQVPSPLKPLSATLSTDLTYATNGTLTLRSLDLQLDPTPTAKNLFQISGATKSSPALFFADLKIRGHSLDLTAYYDQLFPTTTGSFDRDASVSTGPSIATAVATATPPSVPSPAQSVRDIKLNVSVDSLKIHDFNITEMTIPFLQKGQRIEMADGRLKINGTPVTAKIQTKSGQANTPFHFEATTEGLAIGPIVDVWKPDLKGKVGGVLTAQVGGDGVGTTRSDLEQNLTGIVQIAIRNAHLEEVPAVRQLLKQLGSDFMSPEIASSTMDDVDASAKIESGKLFTDNFHAKGSAIEASLRGNVFADQRLDMESTIKVKKEVMARSSILAPILKLVSTETGTQETGIWCKLPGSGAVRGTLTDPTMKFKFDKVVQDSLKNLGVSILKELFKPKKDPNDPQQPDQGQPGQPPPETNPIQDLLNIFKKKK